MLQATCSLTVANGAKHALVYGMIESRPYVEAEAIVYDPQGECGPEGVDRARLRSERFAIVANALEVKSLGSCTSVPQAAKRVQELYQADVVVVKRGALGALVLEPDGSQTLVGPHQTDQVWPLGSGDVFSAVYAWAWLQDGRSPVDAARLASAATAVWCGTQTLPIPLFSGVTPAQLNPGPELMPEAEEVPVYLAGPFFNSGERYIVNLARLALQQLGAKVFSPLHDVGLGGDEVAQKDLEGLKAARSVLGLLDGYDAGTMFELGYATASGTPCVGYCEEPASDHYKMLRGLGIFVTADLSTSVYRAIFAGMRPA